MQAKIQKWGNSLAVRIPKSFAEHSHIEQNSVVEMSTENGTIVLVPVKQAKVSLDSLLEGVTKKNRHGEIVTGTATGQEAW